MNQGDQLSEKPGNVRESDSCYLVKVRRKSCHGKLVLACEWFIILLSATYLRPNQYFDLLLRMSVFLSLVIQGFGTLAAFII